MENAFGIMAARWRILLRTINLLPANVDFVVKATCILHNFLLDHKAYPEDYYDREDAFGNHVPGGWRCDTAGTASDDTLFALEPTHARNYGEYASSARKLFMAYFATKAGEVPWQWHLHGVSKDVVHKNLVDQGLLTP